MPYNIKDSIQPFSISSSNEGFAARQKSVFEQLSQLEKNRSGNNHSDEAETPSRERTLNSGSQRKVTKQFRGRESIFKKPHLPIKPYPKKIPDYCLNPHKWTKYSLEDVKNEDISERGNTTAAMSFLKEMERQKEKIEQPGSSKATGKILFKKSVIPKRSLTETQDEGGAKIFRNSKLVMPEYVVGHRKKAVKECKKSELRSSKKQLKLDHLVDEDNEDEMS